MRRLVSPWKAALGLALAVGLTSGVSSLLFASSPDELFESKLVSVAEPFAPPAIPLPMAPGTGLADHKGKVVVAVFWATWCPVCLREMPEIDALSAEMSDEGVVVLPLSLDTGDEAPAKVQAYFDKNLFEHLPVIVDPGGMNAGAIGLRGTPTSFVLNKDGLVVAAIEGNAHWGSDAARRYLRELLAE
ncbi:MAG: TlpA disulfide reductase family protein [Pseudomonadota bacterium]